MSFLRRAWQRCSAFFRKKGLDADIEAEIAAHLEMAIEENMLRGLSEAEARRLALVSMGGIEQAKDLHREARGLMKLDIILQDAIHLAHTGPRPRIHHRRSLHPCSRNRGQRSCVQRGQHASAAAASLPGCQQLVWIAPPPTKCGLSCATYSTDAYDTFRVKTQLLSGCHRLLRFFRD